MLRDMEYHSIKIQSSLQRETPDESLAVSVPSKRKRTLSGQKQGNKKALCCEHRTFSTQADTTRAHTFIHIIDTSIISPCQVSAGLRRRWGRGLIHRQPVCGRINLIGETLMSTMEDVIQKIEYHIRKNGGAYSVWYVGIATDPTVRLFTIHGVVEKGDAWIYEDCMAETEARKVEGYFLAKGCDGRTLGGDSSAKYVYVYKKNSYTRP
jgi:hypothetical protein